MNRLLEICSAKGVFPIPTGMPDLIQLISKKVLMAQPGDIHLFIANILDFMIEQRDGKVSERTLQENAADKEGLQPKQTSDSSFDDEIQRLLLRAEEEQDGEESGDELEEILKILAKKPTKN